MGWTTAHRAKGLTNDEWFSSNCLGDAHEIVASSTIRNVYYAAVRTIATGEVWALVCLTQRYPRSRFNFGWKDMDETMGPNAAEAPAKVLDVLSPTTSEYALAWRAACRKVAENKAATGRIKIGTVIRFATPFDFSDGVTRQEFVVCERRKLRGTDNVSVRISGWQQLAFEVVK